MAPKAGNLGSLGNKYMTGKGSQHLGRSMERNRTKRLEVNDVEFVGDKFVFTIRGKKMITVTASSGIKQKIVKKLCKPVVAPEESSV